MDNLMSFGKQAYGAYQESQSHQGSTGGDVGIQGSSALNSSDNQRPGQGVDVDQDTAVQHAAAESGGSSDMFAQAMKMVQQHASSGGEVDEQHVQDSHDQAYSQGNASSLGAGAMGSAAAMQALKSFTSGGNSGGSTGGSFQSKLIGQAMAEAAKLFDQSGGAASGSKEDAVQSAGATMMKLMLKNQVSGMMGGGGSSGGLSSLMGMAKQFINITLMSNSSAFTYSPPATWGNKIDDAGLYETWSNASNAQAVFTFTGVAIQSWTLDLYESFTGVAGQLEELIWSMDPCFVLKHMVCHRSDRFCFVRCNRELVDSCIDFHNPCLFNIRIFKLLNDHSSVFSLLSPRRGIPQIQIGCRSGGWRKGEDAPSVPGTPELDLLGHDWGVPQFASLPGGVL
ncbi:hypothetical protein RQP46_009577 [Phenoliferia psychrophenolica]